MIHIRNVHLDRAVAITCDIPSQEDRYEITISGDESRKAFSEMVRRALNCWPDAHPELKELGDMLMHGQVLQNYYVQRSDKKS